MNPMFVIATISAVIVVVSVGIVFMLHRLLGPKWLERLVLGIQQFRGFKPVWRDLEVLKKSQSGSEAMLGLTASATTDFILDGSRWTGTVQLGPERWSAVCSTRVHSGQAVTVAEVNGLTLVLSPPDLAA